MAERPKPRGFLDRILAPFRSQRVAPTARAGSSGAEVYGGFVVSREKNPALQGEQRYTTFSELLANVSVIAAATRFFLTAISKPNWKVEPAEDSGAKGEEIAEKMQAIIDGTLTPFQRIVRRTALYRLYGYSWQEMIAVRREDGVTGILDIETRPQRTIERWDLDEAGIVWGVIQRSPQTSKELYIPRQKSIYLVDSTIDDGPEGQGMLRHVAEAARQLQRLEELEGVGFEIDLRGIPVGKAPIGEIEADDSLDEASKLAKTAHMRRFLENHIKGPKLALMLDSMTYESQDERQQASGAPKWDMQLLTSANTSAQAVAEAIARKNREIARVFGLEKMLLGEHGGGSLAMSRDKSESFFMIAAETVGEIRQQYQQDLVGNVMTLNGWPEELEPQLKPDAIDQRSIEEIVDSLEKMARAGALLDPADPAINEVRERLGLSKAIVVRLEQDEDASLLPKDKKDPDEPQETTPEPKPTEEQE